MDRNEQQAEEGKRGALLHALMAAPRSPLILLVFLQASKVKLMGVLGDMCYVAYHFLEACNVQALYLSTSLPQAHSDDSTHLEYLPLDIKDAWREATAIRDNVGGFTPEGGPPAG